MHAELFLGDHGVSGNRQNNFLPQGTLATTSYSAPSRGKLMIQITTLFQFQMLKTAFCRGGDSICLVGLTLNSFYAIMLTSA